MENRKIMVEVTKEEYEQIKLGVLDENFEIPKYEDLRKELFNEITDEDAEILVRKYSASLLSLVPDQELVSEILRRTKDTSKTKPITIHDPMANQYLVVTKGELKNLKRRDYSQEGEPIIESEDSFSWVLKVPNNVL